jgi:hypothetical protein
MKERMRSTIHRMPHRRLPILMVKELVAHSAKSLNMFPGANGVSDTLSPRAIVTGLPEVDCNKLRVEFGSHVQVFEDNEPRPGTNSTATRTTGAIALNPTGDAQGDYYFMSLTTGARLSRHQWTELPITADVIKAVEAIAESQGQPVIQGGCMKFEWRPNTPVNDGDDPKDDDDFHV